MRRALSLAAFLLCAWPSPAADHWAHFRGPNGTGLSDATGLPTKWDEKTNITWKTPIHGKGWSSPVVWGKQVWLTTAPPDGKALYALCIDRDSGKVLKDIKVFDNPKPPYTAHPFNSHASPTPVIEEGKVYAHFGSSGTACLDTATGKVLWQRRDLPCNHWRGPGSSPVVWENYLFLVFDGHDKQYVVCLDKRTGETVWKRDRSIDYGTDDGDLKKAYATPSILFVNGRYQLVSPAAGGTIAYDPRTGDEIWKVHHRGSMNAASPPLYGHGLVFLATAYHPRGPRILAVRPDGKGDVTESKIAWVYSKTMPTRPAPLLLGDRIYSVSDQGIATCLDAKTGNLVWSHRLGGNYSSSPVCADGHLYFFDQEGRAHVLAVGPKPKVVAVNTLDAGCMATPAIAGRALFVRTKTHLYRIERR